ncbi:hypothetical protein N657DRAFT_640561 [Parathielavia appendiculata]|uniref:Uncharacterized protein n=1 Tax=Parathielavia appendiculata TaxID=2587402 RepID=A0AAN6Z742_9PEZI|nr:hypothetical protein N657DRAFT_640561 [Parathielavia appendiculata]
MTMQVYRDHILEPIEDNDSGHEQNGLEYFFNYAQFPDFSPIEKAWQGPKYWDDKIVKELAEEGWAAVKQETINDWDCLELEGAMTGI